MHSMMVTAVHPHSARAAMHSALVLHHLAVRLIHLAVHLPMHTHRAA
jgi:hypothetical protein